MLFIQLTYASSPVRAQFSTQSVSPKLVVWYVSKQSEILKKSDREVFNHGLTTSGLRELLHLNLCQLDQYLAGFGRSYLDHNGSHSYICSTAYLQCGTFGYYPGVWILVYYAYEPCLTIAHLLAYFRGTLFFISQINILPYERWTASVLARSLTFLFLGKPADYCIIS